MKLRESKGSKDSSPDEKEMERQMMAAVKRTLDLSREVPGGTHPFTGADVRNGMPYGKHNKDALAVYPPDQEDTSRLYLRHQHTGRLIDGGESIRAYEVRHRKGKREGQHVQVTTGYESKDDREFDRSKGSTTTVHIWDEDGNIIRQKEHKSDGVGLSPLVTKIVTKGINKQLQDIKDVEYPPTLF